MSATVSVVSNGLTGKDLGNLTAAGVWGNRGQLWGDLMMRCGRCMPSASGTRGVDAVAAYILRGDSSSVLDELGADWMTCECGIHERVVWGVRGGEGCDALPYGKHGAIRALYEGDHRVCSVEPGVRKYDLDLARLVELGLGRGRNPMWYARGRGTDPGSLGAHYCYAWLFPCNVVVRVARILGPDVPRWRLLLWYSMVGNKYGSPVEFEQLAGGQLHVVSRMGVWASHDQIVRTIMSGDPNSTVGATQEELDRGGVRRVEEVMGSASESLGSRATGHLERWVTALSSEEWKDLDSALASPVDTVYAPVDLVMGVRIPTYGYRLAEVSEYLQGPVFRRLVEFLDRAGVESQFVVCRVGDVDPDVVGRMLDLAVVLHPVGVTPSFYTKPRDRVRIMALVGDAVLRLLGSIGLYGSGGAIADAAVVMEAAENAELVELTKHERLAGLFQFDSLLELSVHRATHFEALLGGVAMFWGVSAAVAVLSSLDHKLARTGPSKFIEPVGRLNTVAVHSWEWKEFQEWKLRA